MSVAHRKTPVALQLWSIKDEVKRDFAAAVAAVAEMGYSGVELAGYGNLDVKGAKAALAAAGLKTAGMHVGLDALKTNLTNTIGDALELGCKHITCSYWQPIHFISQAVCESMGEQLNEIGALIRPYGIKFSFHNHGSEFKILNGKPAFEWMLGAAEPRNLGAEVDVFWIKDAGYSPGKFLRDHGARVPLIHLKDSKELGTGPVDFEEIFAATDAIGAVEWFIVEVEHYNHDPLKSVALCHQTLKAWGRA